MHPYATILNTSLIKDVGFDDYSFSLIIRQVLLHRSCELVKMICYNFFCSYKNELLSIEQREIVAESKI